ncbi:histidine phosphatase superfamily [Suillus subalutaceus]|uniref:histidine phosphatase superfamily n=1 Tax=Suillus subalutaceus TaxID=48586 RepID=UPI001B878C21|nr:histidine phosphatase superfamily [Suillus subalutaceus]KAG1871757.1 histidine phosphatase superfamily [Suillus subalutaceus]
MAFFITEHIQAQDSELRCDLTLPVFTPEVKRMGGQSRVYLGDPTSTFSYPGSARWSLFLRVGAAFFAGFFVCLAVVAQYVSSNQSCLSFSLFTALLPTHVGAPEWHEYPLAEPTNVFPSMFPSNVGHPGPTQAGAEPGVAATAPSYPLHSGVVHLVSPTRFSQDNAKARTKDFNIFRSWGSLSPWYSIQRGKFGIDSGPEAPDTCNITGVHLLHRHGARYPADYSSGTGPGRFASKLNRNAENVTATGLLSFLDDCSNAQLLSGLTPFGRSQLYGFLLKVYFMSPCFVLRFDYIIQNFSETNTLPVFRTASKTRVLNSAQNFALGFFWLPSRGPLNNTLAPQRSCTNSDNPNRGYRSQPHVNAWKAVYLRDTVLHLQQYFDGFVLDVEDVYAMQELCAYESVALGYSKFCELFTEKEWEGFDYSHDLNFWYNVAWGSPVGRAEGIGYVQELVSRLTQTPIETHNSSTNATLHNTVTFPFGHSLYVDATHKTVVLSVLTALNLSSFAAMRPLPSDHIPEYRMFRTRELAPFANNVQFQHKWDVLDPCFVDAQKENIRNTDWDFACNADLTIPDGWETTTGYPPL